MGHVVSVQVPSTGIELQLDCGMTIYVYRSQIDDRVVVELETGDAADDSGDFVVTHDLDGVPQLRVMVNEAVVADAECV
jgi:hypothetical protein